MSFFVVTYRSEANGSFFLIILSYMAAFSKVLELMNSEIQSPPVSVTFAEDDEFTSVFVEDFIPSMPPSQAQSLANDRLATATAQQKLEVIELLDDD